MKNLLILTAITATALATPAAAATRNYSVTSFDRIRVEGPFQVTLVTRSAPFARATGSNAAIDAVTVRVEGTTLLIQANRQAWGGSDAPPGAVTIAVGTHDLNYGSVNGTGSLAIDAVRGLAFSLTVSGSGAGSIGKIEVDNFKLALAGTGSATLAGKAANCQVLIRGASTLDATGLAAKDVVLAAQGPAQVKLTASNSAKVTAGGTATIAIGGNPACTVKAIGAAAVTGCR